MEANRTYPQYMDTSQHRAGMLPPSKRRYVECDEEERGTEQGSEQRSGLKPTFLAHDWEVGSGMQNVLSSSACYLSAVSKLSSLYPDLSEISFQVQEHSPPFLFCCS